MQIDGSTFIVTGGASGLGAATTRMLVACGAHVVIADVNRPAGEALAAELGAAVRFVATDVTQEADGQAAVAAAVDAGGAGWTGWPIARGSRMARRQPGAKARTPWQASAG